jgi:hypothetical protein
MLVSLPMIFTLIARRFTVEWCDRKLAIALVLACTAATQSTALFADTIVLKNPNGTEEEYSGSVVSADESLVRFQMECSGTVQNLKWGDRLKSVRLNYQCLPTKPIGAGGFVGIDCRKRFLVIDSVYEEPEYLDKFEYSTGELNTKDGGGYLIQQRAIRDVKGKLTTIPNSKKFYVDITHMRSTEFCTK